MQAKAYIESSKPERLGDISRIKDVGSGACISTMTQTSSSFLVSNYFSPLITAILIFCTYLFLNVLILLFTVLYLGKVFRWIEQPQHKKLKDLYKASAIVLSFINLGTLMYDIILLTANTLIFL